jgi:hypothetical protein
LTTGAATAQFDIKDATRAVPTIAQFRQDFPPSIPTVYLGNYKHNSANVLSMVADSL